MHLLCSPCRPRNSTGRALVDACCAANADDSCVSLLVSELSLASGDDDAMSRDALKALRSALDDGEPAIQTAAVFALSACFRGCGDGFRAQLAARGLLDALTRLCVEGSPAVDGCVRRAALRVVRSWADVCSLAPFQEAAALVAEHGKAAPAQIVDDRGLTESLPPGHLPGPLLQPRPHASDAGATPTRKPTVAVEADSGLWSSPLSSPCAGDTDDGEYDAAVPHKWLLRDHGEAKWRESSSTSLPGDAAVQRSWCSGDNGHGAVAPPALVSSTSISSVATSSVSSTSSASAAAALPSFTEDVAAGPAAAASRVLLALNLRDEADALSFAGRDSDAAEA